MTTSSASSAQVIKNCAKEPPVKLVRPLCFALLLAAAFTFPQLGWTQSATSSLTGTVTDAREAVIVGAELTLSNPQTGFSRTVESDGQGDYRFLQVPPAPYQLTIAAPGFETIKRENVVLQVSSPATLNVTLQVAGQAVTVEVTGETPAVNTTDATCSVTFSVAGLLTC